MSWFKKIKGRLKRGFKKAKHTLKWGLDMFSKMLKEALNNKDISIGKDMSEEDILLAIEAKQDEIREALNKIKEFREAKLIELQEELNGIDEKLVVFNKINKAQLEALGSSVKSSIMDLVKDRNAIIDKITQIKRKSDKEKELEAYSQKLDKDYERIRQELKY